MKHYDYIFTGTGLSALMTVYKMVLSGKFNDKRILLIDENAKKTNDRTWCFWEKNNIVWEDSISQQWNLALFANEDFRRDLDLKPKKVSSTTKPKLSDKPVAHNLTALQSLLSSRLAEQIQKNMGKGNARNVLNYRTGRLAESARVERLSESKAGLVTAFYSYMRNPYATFSEGGAQQMPRSRDPKLLISKSIRELGATIAHNRMRAVLV